MIHYKQENDYFLRRSFQYDKDDKDYIKVYFKGELIFTFHITEKKRFNFLSATSFSFEDLDENGVSTSRIVYYIDGWGQVWRSNEIKTGGNCWKVVENHRYIDWPDGGVVSWDQ